MTKILKKFKEEPKEKAVKFRGIVFVKSRCIDNHQEPELNYVSRFQNGETPWRVQLISVPPREFHLSRIGVNGSLLVAGGRLACLYQETR